VSVDGGSLVGEHDSLLLDLDGTVFRGPLPTPGAVEVLSAVGVRTVFLTNSASRSADEVAQHLCGLGLMVDPDDIVTSARSAARAIAHQLPQGSTVLVVGTDSLAAAINTVGLRPVPSYSDAPVAVVQGHSPHTSWADLAEAALAIRGGALWTATNGDLTLPSELGLLPGNGSMVAGCGPRPARSLMWSVSRARRCFEMRWLLVAFRLRWWLVTALILTLLVPMPLDFPVFLC
jgi:glycerol-1-phosphatase